MIGTEAARARASARAAASASAAALELQGVTCTFVPPVRGALPYTAVQDASLRVSQGEFVSIVGPTGCGKSTLLNVAAGLVAPTSGKVLNGGVPLVGLNRDAGYLFQADALLPWRDARDNVAAGLLFGGVDRVEAARRAEDWLVRVGLGGFGNRYPHQLSGGMRKRVALAQTLILDPKIVLMDEPFSALDVQTRQLMENEVLELWSADRKSVVFITHDLEEAIALSDRVVVLSAGPATRPIGEFPIDLPRPRDVAEVRLTGRFLELHKQIWDLLKAEVLKGYAQQKRG
ncbi:MAG: ABC transporter ATP-binding protein [Myxococcales bacterium]